MSYYTPQGSYVAQPVAYSSSRHGHGYDTYAAQPQYADGYYAGQPTYAGSNANPVVVMPSSSHRSRHSHRSRSRSRSRHGHGHRHHRHHSSTPQVISTVGTNSGVGYVDPSYAQTAYTTGHQSRYNSSGLTFTDRLRRFFGLAPRSVSGGVQYKHQGRYSSWGFLGRSKRRRYIDARTGAEVDKRGRPVIRV